VSQVRELEEQKSAADQEVQSLAARLKEAEERQAQLLLENESKNKGIEEQLEALARAREEVRVL
jgi:chromosome segregation ATPase